MAIDPCTANLSKLDAARIKIKMEASKVSFDLVVLSDKIKRHSLAIFPVVLEESWELTNPSWATSSI